MLRRLVVALVAAWGCWTALAGCTSQEHFCGAPGARPEPRKACAGDGCVVEGHPLGKEIAFPWLDEGERASADLILQDVWPVPRFEPVHLPSPLTWQEDPYGEKYWQYVFYGLRPTAHLLWAFRETGDRRYRDKLVEVLTGFADHGHASPFGRDKHGTAFRAMVLVNSYWKLKHAHALAPEEAQKLEGLIREDGAFLADPQNFQAGFNHGFSEAAALLLVAANFPDWPESSGWRELALARYDGILTSAVGPDGVLNENSTYYEFYVLAQVWQMARWARAHGVELSPRLDSTLAQMTRFSAYVVQPDGRIPMLGGSQARQVRSYERGLFGEMGWAYPELGYMLSGGRCGEEPRERLALFRDAGLAILRSAFGPRREYLQQTHVVFDAGPYRTDHSHLDALSVHLYAGGRTLLTDPGIFTEEEGEEKHAFLGTRAHNTVVVDGQDQHEGTGALGVSVERDGWLYQSGTHGLYDGVVHWRAVMVLERDVVLVLDQLTSATPHHYEQRWHLPPDLSVGQVPGIAAITDRFGRRVLEVRHALPDGLSTSTVRGGTSPLDGWYSEKYEVRVPATVLLYQREGTEAHYATLFTAGRAARRPARILANAATGSFEVVLCAAGHGRRILVEAVGEADEHVSVDSTSAACDQAR